MTEETWHKARLIPTSGISGADEQERRATSALLAVVSAVSEFGKVLTRYAGAPAGNIETFIEVPFKLGDREVIPDGLIRVTRGKTSWTALVEVKTGKNPLEREQLEAYLDVAKEHNFDALLTISNEISTGPGVHPTEVDRRRRQRVRMVHLSWTKVLTEAVMQKKHRGVADPDQAWILGELIRYLEHPRSGALEFDDMGPSWVSVRDGVRSGTLRVSDKSALDVAARWDQLIRFASLQLGRQLGTDVQPVLSRKERDEPAVRAQGLVEVLCDSGVLEGAVRIPNTVAPIRIRADLRAGQLHASIDVDAPSEGRPATRVKWLTRQLKDAPGTLRVDAFAARSRTSTSELLDQVRADPMVLVQDPKRELKGFTLTLMAPMGTKRGSGRGGLITSVLELLDRFYETTVQTLKPWSPPAPKMRKEPAEAEAASVISSTALSSQDGDDDSDEASATQLA